MPKVLVGVSKHIHSLSRRTGHVPRPLASRLLPVQGDARGRGARAPRSGPGRAGATLVPRAHGLPLDAPRALLVRAVAHGALVRLHLPPGRDDRRLREAVRTWNAETVCIRHVRERETRSARQLGGRLCSAFNSPSPTKGSDPTYAHVTVAELRTVGFGD